MADIDLNARGIKGDVIFLSRFFSKSSHTLCYMLTVLVFDRLFLWLDDSPLVIFPACPIGLYLFTLDSFGRLEKWLTDKLTPPTILLFVNFVAGCAMGFLASGWIPAIGTAATSPTMMFRIICGAVVGTISGHAYYHRYSLKFKHNENWRE